MPKKVPHRIRVVVEMSVLATTEEAAVRAAMSHVQVSTLAQLQEAGLAITASPVTEEEDAD